MADLHRKGGEMPGMGTDAKEKAERDARWVGEWSDDLTVAIALKEWNKAVDLIDQGVSNATHDELSIDRICRASKSRSHATTREQVNPTKEPINIFSSGVAFSSLKP